MCSNGMDTYDSVSNFGFQNMNEDDGAILRFSASIGMVTW